MSLESLGKSTVLAIGGAISLLLVYLPVRAPSASVPSASKPPAQAPSTVAPNTLAADAQSTQVDFADNQPLTMDSDGKGHYVQSLFVKNDESVTSSLKFTMELENAKGELVPKAPVLVPSSSEIAANSISAIRLEIDAKNLSAPLNGYLRLVASASGHKSSTKYRAIKIPLPLPSLVATRLLWLSLVATTVVAFVAFIVLLGEKIQPNQKMGSPTWSFGDSWGTNIAAVGTLLNSLLNFSVLPDQTLYLSKNSYLCVSLIFGAVIALAPSIYALVRTPSSAPAPGPGASIQYQGYVGFFILASLVTSWGAIGQVITIGLLFQELENVRIISHSILVCLTVVIGAVGLLLLLYEGRTMVQTAKLQRAAQSAGGGAASPLPTWSLL